MPDRKVYVSDILKALVEYDLAGDFELWADRYCPDVPSYFEVIADIAQDRGAAQLLEDITSGKFEEEIRLDRH